MYGYKKRVEKKFEDVVEKVTQELAQEGFGVLTEIDVKQTMKKKLGKEYENYKILGACNPRFADRALQHEKEIGLLLPCNVIIYEERGTCIVSAILPTVAMSIVSNESLRGIAQDVEEKLMRVIDRV